MRYEHILAEVLGMPWAITRPYLATISEIIARRVAGIVLTEAEIESRIAAGQERAAMRPSDARVGTIAVMPLIGALLPRGEALQQVSGAVSVQQLTKAFDQLVADETVSAVVLDFDSPGGSVGGIAEFADRVFAARRTKPVVAIANPTMASAAYWIGAAASHVIATPTALVGSIGVYSSHADVSEALKKEGVKITLISAGDKKVLGNPFEALSDEGRAEIQKRVDEFYGMFVKGVARGRGVAASKVREGFGNGGVVGAAEAVSLGLADQVGTFDDAIAAAVQLATGKRVAVGATAPATAIQAGEPEVVPVPAPDVESVEARARAEATTLRELLAARGV